MSENAAKAAGAYKDVIAFLSAVEGTKGTRRKQRTTLSPSEVNRLRRRLPGIPWDYLDYLLEVGWGSFRDSQFMVYAQPMTPVELLGEDVVGRGEPGGKRVLLFGDNFSEDFSGFLPDAGWAIVTTRRAVGKPHRTKKRTFGAYIRQAMFMGPDGEDIRD